MTEGNKVQCNQTYDNTIDKVMLDVTVPYRVLHAVNDHEIVIQRWDKQRFNQETRWIVNKSRVAPWDELPHVELAKTLNIDEEVAKEILNLFHEYGKLEIQAVDAMGRVLRKIEPFNQPGYINEWIELSKHTLAGSALDRIMNERRSDLLEECMKALGENDRRGMVKKLRQKAEEGMPYGKYDDGSQ